MASGVYKKSFTDVGELLDTPEYGLVIKLTFGKALKRVCRHLFGIKLEVGFKELEYQRSAAQNRWLWGVAYTSIAAWYKDTQGEKVTKEAIHAHTLQVILGYEIQTVELFGKQVINVTGKSTSKLNTKEFMTLADDLIAYWQEKGCNRIKLPRENNFLSDFIEEI